jgi:hypothetical protein
MSTWKELEAELAKCEREILIARNEMDKKAQKDMEREQAVLQKIQDLRVAHEEKKRASAEEYEQQLREMEETRDSQVRIQVEGITVCEQRTQTALAVAEDCERTAADLQKQITALHADLTVRMKQSATHFDQVREQSERDVQELNDRTNQLVRDASMFASEAQEKAMELIRNHQQLALQVKDQICDNLLPHSDDPTDLVQLDTHWPDGVLPLRPCAPRPRALEQALESFDRTLREAQHPPALQETAHP